MFEYFTFAAPALLDTSSCGGGGGNISPTNTEYKYFETTINHVTTTSKNLQTTPTAINDLVFQLGSQSLNSPTLLTDQNIYEVQTRSPNAFLPPSPIEENEVSSLYHTLPDTDSAQNDVSTPPPDKHFDMVHPNLLSFFHPQTEESSRRTQRQILQEHQCRSTFTRDLQQLLEEMIENGDQCKLAEAPSTISSPPPSRGRNRSFNTRAPLSYRNNNYTSSYEDDGLCESDDNSISSVSTLRTPSTMSSSALTYRASTTSLCPRRSISDSRNSRHRRVASEGNIEIDFDANDVLPGGEISLRRAGAPVGVVKVGCSRNRGDSSVQRNGWRKNVTKLRKSRREKLTRRTT